MTIRLLVGDLNRIDFETPVEMNEKQRTEFLEFLETLFEPVEIGFDEFRDSRLGSKEIHSSWTAKEYKILLDIGDPIKASEKLGRTVMSVIMKSGKIVPTLISWCDEKKIDFENIKLTDIEDYLKELEGLKIKRREEKKKLREVIKKIETILNDKKEPCMVGDKDFCGGECKDGFYDGCRTCPRSKRFIRTEEDIKLFNKILDEEFED